MPKDYVAPPQIPSSKFTICIMREDGHPVYFKPGSAGEVNLLDAFSQRAIQTIDPSALIDQVVARVVEKGVGVFCTTEHVKEDVRAALIELQLPERLNAAIRKALHDVLFDLKSTVQPAG